MQGSAIEAERGLQERLRESARRELGPEANDSEVEALADEAYWGPEPSGEYEETEAERPRPAPGPECRIPSAGLAVAVHVVTERHALDHQPLAYQRPAWSCGRWPRSLSEALLPVTWVCRQRRDRGPLALELSEPLVVDVGSVAASLRRERCDLADCRMHYRQR